MHAALAQDGKQAWTLLPPAAPLLWTGHVHTRAHTQRAHATRTHNTQARTLFGLCTRRRANRQTAQQNMEPVTHTKPGLSSMRSSCRDRQSKHADICLPCNHGLHTLPSSKWLPEHQQHCGPSQAQGVTMPMPHTRAQCAPNTRKHTHTRTQTNAHI